MQTNASVWLASKNWMDFQSCFTAAGQWNRPGLKGHTFLREMEEVSPLFHENAFLTDDTIIIVLLGTRPPRRRIVKSRVWSCSEEQWKWKCSAQRQNILQLFQFKLDKTLFFLLKQRLLLILTPTSPNFESAALEHLTNELLWRWKLTTTTELYAKSATWSKH